MGFELVGIGVDHDLAVLAAERLRDAGAGHAGDLVANLELRQVAQLRFVQAFAFEGDQADRQAGGIELQHHRRQRAGRQAAQLRHGQVGDGGDSRIGIGARLEVDLDDADAGQRARFDVLDAAAQREEAFEAAGDVGFDLLRRHAGIERRHHHHRNVHRREHVHRHARQAGDADHGDDQADHDDEVGIADGEAGHSLLLGGGVMVGDLGLHFLARLQAGAAADHHQVAFVQAGADFDSLAVSMPELDLANLDAMVRA